MKATPAEVRAYVQAAKSLASHGLARADIRAKLAELHGLDDASADRAIAVAWQEMRETLRIPREDARAAQLERLLAELADAKSRKRDAAVARFEAEIAQLLGTSAPKRVSVEVSGSERERVLNVLMLLDEDAIGGLLAGERVPLGHAQRDQVDAQPAEEP